MHMLNICTKRGIITGQHTFTIFQFNPSHGEAFDFMELIVLASTINMVHTVAGQ